MIDARLNDTDVPEAGVVSYLKRLTEPEQRELHKSSWRVQRIGKSAGRGTQLAVS